MGDTQSELWRALALEALRSARVLGIDFTRGSANRLYYALFAEMHARLIEAGTQPRRFLGTWSHEALPQIIRHALTKKHGLVQAVSWSRTLRQARQLREAADYQPGESISSANVIEMMRETEKIVVGAEK